MQRGHTALTVRERTMNEQRSTHDDLELRVARKVQERGGCRIRGFRIERCNGRVMLHGCAELYYAWQLAIAACLEILSGQHELTVDGRFEVNRSNDRT